MISYIITFMISINLLNDENYFYYFHFNYFQNYKNHQLRNYFTQGEATLVNHSMTHQEIYTITIKRVDKATVRKHSP